MIWKNDLHLFYYRCYLCMCVSLCVHWSCNIIMLCIHVHGDQEGACETMCAIKLKRQNGQAVNLIELNDKIYISSLALSLLLSHWSFQKWLSEWWTTTTMTTTKIKLSHSIVHIGCWINTNTVFKRSPCRFDENECRFMSKSKDFKTTTVFRSEWL